MEYLINTFRQKPSTNQLLQIDKKEEKITVSSTGKDLIRDKYSDPLTIVTFAGMPGRGKSTTCCNLYNYAYSTCSQPYPTSVGQESFTKGGWIGTTPLKQKDSDREMMLLDLEGLEQNELCYHLTLAGMIFSDVFVYLSAGARVEDIVISVLTAVVALVNQYKININFPHVVFLMTNSPHDSLKNTFETDTGNVDAEKFRDIACVKLPEIAKAFGRDKLHFLTLSRPKVRDGNFKTFKTGDKYHSELGALINLISTKSKGVLGGIDRKVQILEESISCLNNHTTGAVTNVILTWYRSALTTKSQTLSDIHKASLELLISQELEKANIDQRNKVHEGRRVVEEQYNNIKQAYDKELQNFGLQSINLPVEQKVKLVEIEKFPFPSKDVFHSYCNNASTVIQKKLDFEFSVMVDRAIGEFVKVRGLGVGKCPGCHSNIDSSRVVHVSCLSGRKGTWLWIRRGFGKEKVCDLCRTISTFTETCCGGCGHLLSTEVY